MLISIWFEARGCGLKRKVAVNCDEMLAPMWAKRHLAIKRTIDMMSRMIVDRR
jgi:hypothetical protein